MKATSTGAAARRHVSAATGRARTCLAEYGFGLPSCTDNRPLKSPNGFDARPDDVRLGDSGALEMERAGERLRSRQIVRPTGLVDPPCIIRPIEHQVDDLKAECREAAASGHRVLVTTVTKKWPRR